MLVRRSNSSQRSAGSAEELRALYDQYFDFTWRSLKRLGVPESGLDDATQEVFVVLYRRLPEFEGRSKMSTWIFRIALHVAQHAQRAKARSRLSFPGEAPELESSEPSAEQKLVAESEARLVRSLLDKLSLEQRAVLVLAEFEAQTPAEIAETLNIPRNTVYSRLRTAREELAEHYRRATAQGRGEQPNG